MKNHRMFFLSLLMLTSINARDYDGRLQDYYSVNRPSAEDLIHLAENVSGVKIKEGSKRDRVIRSFKRDYLSISHQKDGMFVSFHAVDGMAPIAYPFMRVFADLDNNPREISSGSFGHQLDLLGVQVLELHDARVTSEYLAAISGVKSIEKLGLPAQGMGFVDGIKFPKSVEMLIVRNSFLNKVFFEALDDAKNLKHLVISGSSFSEGSPRTNGFSYSSDARDTSSRIFRGISIRTEHLEIVSSDPFVFDHIVMEKWPKLKTLKVSLYPDNIIALNYMREELGNFPSLERFFAERNEIQKDVVRRVFNGSNIVVEQKSRIRRE